jgi:UDP-N-acetylglucosamine 2-epimerase (non-hydrolysing)
MKLLIVYGTRPELIKLSEIIRLAELNSKIDPFYVHTGQHYSYNMNKRFLEELNFPKTNINLEIGSGSQAYQVGIGLIKLEKLFLKEKPDVVMAEGDTNTVLSASLASTKTHIPFAHVEAGIRSFDKNMQEEINRILTDQISEYCFAPTKIAVKNLKREGICDNRIYLTGNTIVEAVQGNLKFAEKSNILEKLSLNDEEYIVLTAHRAENVDNKERVLGIIKAMEQIKEPIIYPIHPRTLKRLKEFGLIERIENIKNLKLIETLGYFDFLKLCAESKLIITDSGGIQEECTIYKKSVLVIRDNTERPEILEKFGWLTGCSPERIINRYDYIIENYRELERKMKNLVSPFGDGVASERIISYLESNVID